MNEKDRECYDKLMNRAKPRYYDMNTQEISMQQWHQYIERIRECLEFIIGNDIIGDYRVSTVYLGLDMGLMNPAPLIFETMVFLERGKEDVLDLHLWQERYTYQEQALEGHKTVVKMVETFWKDHHGKLFDVQDDKEAILSEES